VNPRGRPARILPGPRCGWPDQPCKAPDSAHAARPGERRTWTYHDVQCQVPNPDPGPHLDGYPECALVGGHAGDCDYRRHAVGPEVSLPAARAAAAAVPPPRPAPEPELEAAL
jgi:hypothetical protein